MAEVQSVERPATSGTGRRGGLVRRYFLVCATLVGGSLVAGILVEMGFRFQEARQNVEVVHRQMAELAALRIRNYIEDVARAVNLAAHPRNLTRGRPGDDYNTDLRELLKNVPAIRNVIALDPDGHETLRQSRIGRSVPNAGADHSSTEYFTEARSGKVYFGPVIFPADSFEPRIVIAAPIEPFVGEVVGVLAAEVNVRYVWDIVQEIQVGESGYAYVVDGAGSLVAHPDLHLVLQRKNLSDHPQVAALRNPAVGDGTTGVFRNLASQLVLVSHVRIPNVGWTVFVERPLTEVYAPLLASLARTGGILLLVCLMTVGAAVLLGRRVVGPIEVLRRGAARLEAGELDARLELKTGDEFEELAEDFNRMSHRLQDSHATLERKVEERTQQLELANQAKSRFLAAASHDLRQPLHALGLFVAQLRARMSVSERSQVVERIDTALAAMNELFSALLDVSKLDAGVLTPEISEFPVARLLERIDSTFAEAARAKKLSLHVVASSAWVRTDFILLERILFNLVSNAVRYSSRGGLVVGCRRRGAELRIEVWDTGIGIPADQRRNIFGEFYRLGEPDRDRRAGLGLGLAIVDRLCRLLDHPIALASILGKGSCFSVTVPSVATRAEDTKPPKAPAGVLLDISHGKIVVVIDDDPLVLDGMRGLFRSWGCQVVTGATDAAALTNLAALEQPPDLIISDYLLPDGKTGIEAIERLRKAFDSPIPAFLISGDISPERLREARASGYHLQHKPVEPMVLRAMLNQLLKTSKVARLPVMSDAAR
ncbi:MAG TPA: cache domain-containing protein [Xanthobacteraceae bacterium]|jgi:signal transduction histidine kinase/CheY-like chemotaxis protein